MKNVKIEHEKLRLLLCEVIDWNKTKEAFIEIPAMNRDKYIDRTEDIWGKAQLEKEYKALQQKCKEGNVVIYSCEFYANEALYNCFDVLMDAYINLYNVNISDIEYIQLRKLCKTLKRNQLITKLNNN